MAKQSFSNLEVFNEFTEVMLLWSLNNITEADASCE